MAVTSLENIGNLTLSTPKTKNNASHRLFFHILEIFLKVRFQILWQARHPPDEGRGPRPASHPSSRSVLARAAPVQIIAWGQ